MSGERGNARLWHAIGATQRGSSHERSGAPNQDAYQLSSDTPASLLIAVVSDGHGSPKSFRSHLGSKLAVKTASQILSSTAARITAEQSDVVIETELREHLPRDLHKAWVAAVESDIDREPFTDDEMQVLAAKQGTKAADAVRHEKRIAYGATLLAVVAAPRFLLYVQLGDGDILLVREGAIHRAFPKDPRLMANETTSLCTPEAWNDVVISYVPLAPDKETVPDLILLATDGYGNSYADDADFHRVATDLLTRITARGLEAVQAKLPDWLDATSRGGSGDDITACLLIPVTNSHSEVTSLGLAPEPAKADGEQNSETYQAVSVLPASAEPLVQSESEKLQERIYDRSDGFTLLYRNVVSLWKPKRPQ